jgi:NADH:ubiquinone oxidoreductase subunit F (NADH-binding)
VPADCGRIDPTNIAHYMADGGYQALIKALSRMTPEPVIDEVQAAKLRGRGGAGTEHHVYRQRRTGARQHGGSRPGLIGFFMPSS